MKRNILLVEPLCFHCEDFIDAVEMIEEILDDGIQIIDIEDEEIPEDINRLPIESFKGRILTPTLIKIDGNSMRKFIATELFFGDLGLLEGLFKYELPTEVPIRKPTRWVE